MSRNLIWIASTIVVLSVPLVPDSQKYIIQISEPAKERTSRSHNVVSARCDLINRDISDQGLQVCTYRCNSSDRQVIYKTSRPNVVCQQSVVEQVKIPKKG